MTNQTLQQLYSVHNVDVQGKRADCISVYNRLFADYREKSVRILVIGTQHSSSFAVWSEYFSNLDAVIQCTTSDDADYSQTDNVDINFVTGDINDNQVLEQILTISESFDIIIDQSSDNRDSDEILTTFARVFPYIAQNGIYVIEDLFSHTRVQLSPASDAAQAFFLNLADHTRDDEWNSTGWGNRFGQNCNPADGLVLTTDLLNDIGEVEIINSLCVIRQATNASQTARRRIVSGNVASARKHPTLLKAIKGLVSDTSSEYSKTDNPLDELKKLKRQTARYQRQVEDLKQDLQEAENTIEQLINSRSWKLTRPLRGLSHTCIKLKGRLGRLVRSVKRRLTSRSYTDLKSNQKLWEQITGAQEAEEILSRISQLNRPLISIIIPTFNTQEKFLRDCIESVLAQSYSNWELCISDDASTESRVREVIEEYTKQDPRIKAVFRKENGHIAESLISGAELATGDYISFLDHDDLLTRHALLFVVDVINKSPESEMIYTDEDHVDTAARHTNPFFKPDWSPSLLYSQNYIGHFLCMSRDLYDRVGGYRAGFDGAQDYDLVLRAGNAARKVYHIPKVLYHWREHSNSTSVNAESKPYAHDAGKKAVQQFLSEKYGTQSRGVEDGKWLFTYSPTFECDKSSRVSIIIPTKDKTDLLDDCIESIRKKTSHTNWEIIIIDNCSVEQTSFQYFEEITKKDDRIRVIEANFEFNWSKINNLGAQSATGEVLVFLNNDTLIISPDWLEKLASWALLPNVGVVGAQLLYEDNTIQHAGVVVGMGGWADHVFKNQIPSHRSGPFVSPVLNRNVLAVTGACQVIQKSKFDQLGGFDENFIICGSDVEICLKSHQNSLENIYCAEAVLYHLESKSRSSFIPEQDFRMSEIKYAPYRNENKDPFYNENLDIMSTSPRMVHNA